MTQIGSNYSIVLIIKVSDESQMRTNCVSIMLRPFCSCYYLFTKVDRERVTYIFRNKRLLKFKLTYTEWDDFTINM